MLAAEFTTEVVSGAIGGGTVLGLLAVALKRTWSDRDTGAQIYIKAREDAKAEANIEISRLRDEFDRRMKDYEKRTEEEFTRLHDDIQSLNTAVAEILTMVRPEKIEEAMSILVALGLPTRTAKLPTPPKIPTSTKEEPDE